MRTGRKPRPRYVLQLEGRNNISGREIAFWPQGSRTYLWVGDHSEYFGSVSGPRTLEKFARALLEEVTAEGRKKRQLRDRVRARIAAKKEKRSLATPAAREKGGEREQ